ncbi:MAG TPA: bifunctional riboflavin kinase/FAD synthetase [Gemmatimonadales bacterium]
MTAALPFPPAGSVVTVGSFDGVHVGHVAVLREISERARAAGRVSVLVTFEPHPMEVVNPTAAPPLLTTPVERREILAQTDLDYAVILRFDERLRAMAPERFVRDILLDRLAMRELVIGEDHGFGRGRQGDVAMLRVLGARLGFAIDVVPPVRDPVAGIVSSSRIRSAVAHGDLALARRLLGRPFALTAVVIQGARRGQSIGVPTINLPVPPRKMLPPDGVYAVRVEWPGGRAGGMLNQGPRPTVGDLTRTIEAHVFDFDGDLYGQWAKIEWVARLRDVQRFESLAALRQQLARDRIEALRVLQQNNRE